MNHYQIVFKFKFVLCRNCQSNKMVHVYLLFNCFRCGYTMFWLIFKEANLHIPISALIFCIALRFVPTYDGLSISTENSRVIWYCNSVLNIQLHFEGIIAKMILRPIKFILVKHSPVGWVIVLSSNTSGRLRIDGLIHLWNDCCFTKAHCFSAFAYWLWLSIYDDHQGDAFMY